jgi:secernin
MCDTLCVRHGSGMWFAKNSDRHPAEVQVVEWHPRRAAAAALETQYLSIPDAGASAFLGSRPTWLWGCEHGVNEHGVAIGNEKIFTVDTPHALPPALLGMDVVRLVLERAHTADDALDLCTSLLEQFGQGGSGEPHDDEPYFSSFLLADAHSGWVVETSNRTWVAKPVGDGTSISNRVSVTTDWTRASPDVAPGTDFDEHRLPQVPTARADHRLAVTRGCVARGPVVTARELASTLRDHSDPSASGFSVCLHRPDFHAQTTASMIVDLRADGGRTRAWACLGNPCVGVYLPMFPPAVVPELADEKQWQRFARLRDRMEAERDALERVRRVLAPVEDELWARADDAYATGSGGVLDAFTAAAYVDVDAALDRLGV